MALVQLERKKVFHPKTVIGLRERRWWKEAASDEVIIYRKIHDHGTQVPAQGPSTAHPACKGDVPVPSLPPNRQGEHFSGLQAHEPHCARGQGAPGCGMRLLKIQQGEGQWGMRPGSDVAAASLGHRLGVGAGEQLWREGVSCRWDFSQLLPHGLLPEAAPRLQPQHIWAGLAAKPQRGNTGLEGVSEPRSVCTFVTTQGTGLKRRPLCKNNELRHPNGVEISKWSQDIQMAMCPLGLWMYLQIGLWTNTCSADDAYI